MSPQRFFYNIGVTSFSDCLLYHFGVEHEYQITLVISQRGYLNKHDVLCDYFDKPAHDLSQKCPRNK